MTPTTRTTAPPTIYTDTEKATVRKNATYIAELMNGGVGTITDERDVTVEYYWWHTPQTETGLEADIAKWHRLGEDKWTLRRSRGWTSIHSLTDAVRTRRVQNWKIVR